MNARQLSRDLRKVQSGFLDNRHGIVALGLTGAATFATVSLVLPEALAALRRLAR